MDPLNAPDTNGEQVGAPGVSPTVPAQPATPAPVRREDTVDYWRDKFSGLQGYATEQQTLATNLQSRLNTLATSAAADKTTADAALLAARQENERLTAENNTLLADRNRANRATEISTILTSEFGSIAHLYEAEELDSLAMTFANGKDAELRALFTKKAEKQKASATQRQQDRITGSLPPAAPATQDNRGGVISQQEARGNVDKMLKQHGPNSQQYRDAMNTFMLSLKPPKQGG